MQSTDSFKSEGSQIHLTLGVNDHGKPQTTTLNIDPLPAYPVLLKPSSSAPFLNDFQRIRDQNGVRLFFLEFIACFLFTFTIIVPSAGLVLTNGEEGSFLIAVMCVSISVSFVVYIAAPHSGAILSPPMLIVAAIFRNFPWKMVPVYLVAHFLGSFVAGVAAYGLISPYLDQLDGGNRNIVPLSPTSTAAIFVAMPQPFLDNNHLILSELLGDLIFMFIISGLLDTRHPLLNLHLLPLLVGAAVFLVACVFGWIGFVLNPFRDFGPRVYLSAYYDGIFTYHDHYSMIALFIPFVGHIMGAILYDFMVNSRYPSVTPSQRNANNMEAKTSATEL